MLSCNRLPNLVVNQIVLASHCYHMLQWSGDSDHKLFSQYKTLHRTYENASYDVPSINTNALQPTHWTSQDKGNEVRQSNHLTLWEKGISLQFDQRKKNIMGWCVKGLISCLVREKYIYWLTKYWRLLDNGFVCWIHHHQTFKRALKNNFGKVLFCNSIFPLNKLFFKHTYTKNSFSSLY